MTSHAAGVGLCLVLTSALSEAEVNEQISHLDVYTTLERAIKYADQRLAGPCTLIVYRGPREGSLVVTLSGRADRVPSNDT